MRRVFVAFGVLAGFLVGCNGVPAIEGVTEPLRVPAGFFHRGDLPGATDATSGPTITSYDTPSGRWVQGQIGAQVSGRAVEETYSIAIDLAELGSGYWVVPVGAINPQYGTEREWHVDLDVGGWVPAGNYTMRMVAIDGNGNAGPWRTTSICVLDPSIPYPGSLNACNAGSPPPATAIVLQWDLDVDLDLVVYTPSGDRVDHSHPTTSDVGAACTANVADPAYDPTIGCLDHDSNAECLPDGRNSETLYFSEPTTESGTYGVYADLFDACGFPSVRFVATIYRRKTNPDGTYALVQGRSTTGLIEAISASGGANQPLFVMNVSLP